MSLLTKLSDIPAGQPRRKASELTAQLQAEWNLLSKDEQKAITADAIVELENMRDMKATTEHNVPNRCHADVRANIASITKQVNPLPALLYRHC